MYSNPDCFILSELGSALPQLIVKLQVLGLRLGVDFTFTLDNNDNNDNDNNDNNDNNPHLNNNDNNDNNPHLNFFKGIVIGVEEQGLGIRDNR